MYNVIIIGAGPAGLFAAHNLQKNGIDKILLLDMGKRIGERRCPKSPSCDCDVCDILEGEGGAGGFSDGKNTYSLTRGTQLEELFDPQYEPLLDEIDKDIVKFGRSGNAYEPVDGTPEEFINSNLKFGSYKLRHIGSDGIREFITNFIKDISSSGQVEIKDNSEVVDLIFNRHKADGVVMREEDGVMGIKNSKYLMVATGLQGTPWLEDQLKRHNIVMDHGPAGLGIRIESPSEILAPLFNKFYDFKLEYNYKGMTYRSFCCNRNGYVINENHRTLGIRNVNGHSYINKSNQSDFSNFAIICKIGLDIDPFPQAKVRFIAKNINKLVDGHTVVQGLKDFMDGRISHESPTSLTNKQSKGSVHIGHAMDTDIYEGFRLFLIELGAILPGFISNSSLVYAPEVKYYGRKMPINLNNWKFNHSPNMYILGNASGYLDSFVSAALTGIIAANDIIEKEVRVKDALSSI